MASNYQNMDVDRLMAIDTSKKEGMIEMRAIIKLLQDEVNPSEGNRIYDDIWSRFKLPTNKPNEKKELKKMLVLAISNAFSNASDDVYESPSTEDLETEIKKIKEQSSSKKAKEDKPKEEKAKKAKEDKPKEEKVKKVKEEKAEEEKASKKSKTKKTVSPKSSPKLPSGWTKYVTDDGEPYYQNEKTEEVQWDTPKSPAKSPAKSPKKSPKKSPVKSPKKSPKKSPEKSLISPNFIKGKSEEYLLGIIQRYHPGKNIENIKDYEKLSITKIPGKTSKLDDVIKHIESRDVDISDVPKPSKDNKNVVIRELLKAISKKLKEEIKEEVKDRDYYMKQLKDKKFKNDVSLEYLLALANGKKCDKDMPCNDDEECDLENKLCVPISSENYYDDIDRTKYNKKSFVGSHDSIKKLAPKVASPISSDSESESDSDVEEVDLEDIKIDDISKLSKLQQALVNCLMPSNKSSAREHSAKFRKNKK